MKFLEFSFWQVKSFEKQSFEKYVKNKDANNSKKNFGAIVRSAIIQNYPRAPQGYGMVRKQVRKAPQG